MKREKRMAVDPTTGEKYEIELSTSEAVKQEILKLDYPTQGTTIKEATEKLARKFGLSDEERKAQTKRGERYFGFFHYEVVGPAFNGLLREENTKLIGSMPETTEKQISVEKVCEHLGIHWYRPTKLTQGLRVAYLRSQMAIASFSAKFRQKTNSQNINLSFQDDTALPFDKAA